MMRKLILFTCFAMIFWIGDQTQDPGAQQSADSSKGAARSQEDTPDFAELARIFNLRCTMCHIGAQPPLGLRLDSYANLMKCLGREDDARALLNRGMIGLDEGRDTPDYIDANSLLESLAVRRQISG